MGNTIDYRSLKRGAAVLVALLAGLLMGAAMTAAPEAEAKKNENSAPKKVYALTDANELLRFNGNKPEKTKTIPVTGLEADDTLVGIDFRPSTNTTLGDDPANEGALYGLGDGATDTLYIINEKTGAATKVADLNVGGAPFQLVGTSFGFDFNPTVNRIRIVSDQDQNLRVNPFTGAVTVDGTLAYAAGDPNEGQNPNVTAAAYRNSQPNAIGGVTELYDLDTMLDILAEQDPPNNGTLITEGPLGVGIQGLTGFDIVTRGDSPAGDRGYAGVQPEGSDAAFYSVNLDNGTLTLIGQINGDGTIIQGLAIPIGQK